MFQNLGENPISTVDSMGVEDGEARGEDHQEDDHDAEQDEGAGSEREVLQVSVSKCS